MPKQHGIVVGKRHLTVHGTHPTLGNEEAIDTSTNTLTGLRTFTQTSQDECGNLFSLLTPLAALAPQNPQYSKAIGVGPSSPPVPERIAKRIWHGEYIDMNELLPARLGAPSTTVLDALTGSEKAKRKKTIDTIADWAVCFNSFMSVMAIKKPGRVRDLLAYSSIIVRASQDFNGHPWLEYDTAFRRQAASRPDQKWAHIDSSLWTTTFSRAAPRTDARPLALERRGSIRQRTSPYPSPGEKICFKWNSRKGCDLIACRFLHVCSRCQDKNHCAFQCPKFNGRSGPHPQDWDTTQSFRPSTSRP